MSLFPIVKGTLFDGIPECKAALKSSIRAILLEGNDVSYRIIDKLRKLLTNDVNSDQSERNNMKPFFMSGYD